MQNYQPFGVTSRAVDFHEVQRAMLAGDGHYLPYASTAYARVPAQANGIIKCSFCGTPVAVTIRRDQPHVALNCPGCGAPLEDE